jgi:hypothetical protein
MHRFFLVFAIPLTLAAQYQNNLRVTWIEPGGKEILPAIDQFENSLGKLRDPWTPPDIRSLHHWGRTAALA